MLIIYKKFVTNKPFLYFCRNDKQLQTAAAKLWGDETGSHALLSRGWGVRYKPLKRG